MVVDKVGLVSQIDTPALLIEKSVLERNIARMQRLAAENGVTLRPHIKSHKMPLLAKMQLEAGADGIAVAKIGEAEVMTAAGIDDIQIANQIVGEPKFLRLLDLMQQARVSIAVDTLENLTELSQFFETHNQIIDVLIEIDSGLHRSGIDDVEQAVRLARDIEGAPGVRFAGLMTHAGHVYAARDFEEVEQIGRREGEFMDEMATAIREEGMTVDVVSVGSTPTAPYCSAIPGVTELRAGNYVFNDAMQVMLGSATFDDCALSVLTTVISTPAEFRAVIDAGSKALATDRGAHGNAQLSGFGHIVGKNATLARLSEEHGVILFERETFSIGERLRVIPNHACSVANLFDNAYMVDGDEVLQIVPVEARGRMT
jgi:D-serine deaminase-like pyridoxal phosphate-dependent protein